MTVDAERCARILDTVRETGNTLTVAFNYRFNPVHEKVRALLAEGAIGEVLSVHFEWLLDVRHGADYFRRWHREKQNSGGLMVHKSSHHFDLVNWWLADRPQEVFGYGRLGFYGREAGERHGLRRAYDRAHGAAPAADDPFALDLAADDTLRALYLDAEQDDGYLRDRNVFDGPVTIEDDMAVLVRYTRGATMTYHLTAYSPWEGYRVMFNGSATALNSRWRRAAGSRPGSGSPPAAARCTATPPPNTRAGLASPCARCGGPRSTSRSRPPTRPTAGVTRACSTRCSGAWTGVRLPTSAPRGIRRPPSATGRSRWRSGWPPTGASRRGGRWGCGSWCPGWGRGEAGRCGPRQLQAR